MGSAPATTESLAASQSIKLSSTVRDTEDEAGDHAPPVGAEASEAERGTDAAAAATINGPAASGVWRAFTGLTSSDSSEMWQQRIAAACEAPIWEAAAAESLADQLMAADGGAPQEPSPMGAGLSQRSAAVWALWTMANSPQGCASSFPMSAAFVENWLNMTGLRGPYDLAVWHERVRRACEVDGAGDQTRLELARRYVEADGGDAHSPALVSGAAQAL